MPQLTEIAPIAAALESITLGQPMTNRILNTTVLIAAHAGAAIPVSCVEQGRWSYRGRRSSASDYSLYASLRRTKAARVTQSLRERRRHEADQGEVWDELAQKAAFLKVESPTDAMHAVYERYADDVKAGREAFVETAGQVGALVYVSGEWAGLELLAAPRLFARAWPRMSTGYVAAFRGASPKRAEEQVTLILASLPAIELALQRGAIVILERHRLRLRELPITRKREGGA